MSEQEEKQTPCVKCPDCSALFVPGMECMGTFPAAPAPHWTTTPPTEPGWYWMRGIGDAVADPAQMHIDEDGRTHWWTFSGCMIYGTPVSREWWPVRIKEPKK